MLFEVFKYLVVEKKRELDHIQASYQSAVADMLGHHFETFGACLCKNASVI